MNHVAVRRGRRPEKPAFLRPLVHAPSSLTDSRDPDILALPSPDWLQQTITFTGTPEQLTALKEAAAGSGIVPWVYDYDRMQEDWFHWLAGPPHRMKTSTARILSRQMRDATWEMHESAVGLVGRSKAVPFDLHALCPVPWEILRLGPDDPAALRWMWENWATSWPLRRVEVAEDELKRWVVRLCSADWTCWPILRGISEKFGLQSTVRCDYA